MDTIKVVCGLIFNDNKIFICRRKPEKSLGGFWEFPGGKVELNESYENCLKRELIEELEMTVEVLGHYKTIYHQYEKFNIELIAYKCNFISSNFTMLDHDRYEWINIIDLIQWELAPADIPIAESLMATNI